MTLPQTYNLAMLLRVMRVLAREPVDTQTLVRELKVDPRTIRDLLALGRWLGLLAKGELHGLTEAGERFWTMPGARGLMFRDVVLADEVVQEVEDRCARVRITHGAKSMTREACEAAILSRGHMSSTTARKKASTLARLIEIARDPAEIDWHTGARAWPDEEPDEEFALSSLGRTFLGAMAGRRFGASTPHLIGVPRQLEAFVEDPLYLDARGWADTSQDIPGEVSRWYGGVPVTTETRRLVRQPVVLRRLLVSCAPGVALVLAMALHEDRRKRPTLWLRPDPELGARVLSGPPALVELGDLETCTRQLASALELRWLDGGPAGRDADGAPCAVDGDSLHAPLPFSRLVSMMCRVGLLLERDGALLVPEHVREELNLAAAPGMPTLREELRPIMTDLGLLARRWRATGGAGSAPLL